MGRDGGTLARVRRAGLEPGPVRDGRSAAETPLVEYRRNALDIESEYPNSIAKKKTEARTYTRPHHLLRHKSRILKFVKSK
jgi:hypothetical protein